MWEINLLNIKEIMIVIIYVSYTFLLRHFLCLAFKTKKKIDDSFKQIYFNIYTTMIYTFITRPGV